MVERDLARARKKRKERAQKKRLAQLLEFERPLWDSGARAVAGLDEAGSGPLAGPVVAACVVLDPDRTDIMLGVDDSKKLTAGEREALAIVIRSNARAWAVASASVEEIDRINILQAGLLAMRRALETVCLKLGAVDHLLIDARKLESPYPQTPIVKGDSKSLSIAAASVLAKVDRDQTMNQAAALYPQYGFDKHKGYATEDHIAAVRTHGVTPLHRRSFEPITTIVTQIPLFDTKPYEGRAPNRVSR